MSYLARLRAFDESSTANTVGAVLNRPHSPPSVAFVAPPPGRSSAAAPDPLAARNSFLRSLDIPTTWSAGLLSLSGKIPPAQLSEARWEQILDDADYIVGEWGQKAARLGWTDLELFGCSPHFARRLDRDGLAMLLKGRKVLMLDEHAAAIESGGGSLTMFTRNPVVGSVPIWSPD